jgi:hypothetical protein
MNLDMVLMVIVVAGIALSAAYVRAELIGWRAHGAAERRRASAFVELHAAQLSGAHSPDTRTPERENASLLPSIVQLRGFSPQYIANTDETANAGQRSYPSEERRKRPRQHASQ